MIQIYLINIRFTHQCCCSSRPLAFPAPDCREYSLRSRLSIRKYSKFAQKSSEISRNPQKSPEILRNLQNSQKSPEILRNPRKSSEIPRKTQKSQEILRKTIHNKPNSAILLLWCFDYRV